VFAVGSATVIKEYDTIADANMWQKFSFFNKNSILVFKIKASMRFVQSHLIDHVQLHQSCARGYT
jgi:hypothetical protein